MLVLHWCQTVHYVTQSLIRGNFLHRYTPSTVSEHLSHCTPSSIREGPGTKAKSCAQTSQAAFDKSGIVFPSLEAPPPMTSEAFNLIWFFKVLQTYSARNLKHLQAGGYCPPCSHSTSPAVGTHGCVHSKHELDTDSSAPWRQCPKFSFLLLYRWHEE